MINTLYLPELREMLAEKDSDGLRDFCEALNPVRAADFCDSCPGSAAPRLGKCFSTLI